MTNRRQKTVRTFPRCHKPKTQNLILRGVHSKSTHFIQHISRFWLYPPRLKILTSTPFPSFYLDPNKSMDCLHSNHDLHRYIQALALLPVLNRSSEWSHWLHRSQWLLNWWYSLAFSLYLGPTWLHPDNLWHTSRIFAANRYQALLVV